MTTFLEGVQRLHSESLRSTAAPTSVTGASERNARLFNRYAAAWLELQSERDWRWMRATTDAALTIGQQTYTGAGLSATRFGRWRAEDRTYYPSLYQSGSPNTNWAMSFMALDHFRRPWVYRDNGSSTPIVWSIDESNQFLVGPAPSVAYMLRADYWKEPSLLVADADEPDLPSRFALLPMWRALMFVATADGKPEVFALAEAQYTKMHSDLMTDQARRPYI